MTHWCDCEVRYGPREPERSQADISWSQRLMHNSKKRQYFSELIVKLTDPTISSNDKADSFRRNLLAPHALIFEKYGSVLFRYGMGMALSYKWKSDAWPEHLFDFKEDAIVILQRNPQWKNRNDYHEIESFPLLAMTFSYEIKREENEEGRVDPYREKIVMHATQNLCYGAQASFDSAAL